MLRDIRADVAAVIDQRRQPVPSRTEVQPINQVTAALRDIVSAAIHAKATSLGLSGDSVDQEIQKRHKEIVSELLARHQQGQLALFLDTNGTAAELRRMPPNSIYRENLETGVASIDGKNGRLVGPIVILAEFTREFLVTRGYTTAEALRCGTADGPALAHTQKHLAQKNQFKAWMEDQKKIYARYPPKNRSKKSDRKSYLEWASENDIARDIVIGWVKAEQLSESVGAPFKNLARK